MVNILNPEDVLVFEPKTENRFVAKFPKPFNIPSFVIHNAKRPSFSNKKGTIVWNNMVFLMYDPIAPSTSQAIMEGIRELRKMDSYTLNITIQGMGPVGEVVEDWLVVGEIESIDFGTLDWKSTEPLTIALYLDVHHCILNF